MMLKPSLVSLPTELQCQVCTLLSDKDLLALRLFAGLMQIPEVRDQIKELNFYGNFELVKMALADLEPCSFDWYRKREAEVSHRQEAFEASSGTLDVLTLTFNELAMARQLQTVVIRPDFPHKLFPHALGARELLRELDFDKEMEGPFREALKQSKWKPAGINDQLKLLLGALRRSSFNRNIVKLVVDPADGIGEDVLVPNAYLWSRLNPTWLQELRILRHMQLVENEAIIQQNFSWILPCFQAAGRIKTLRVSGCAFTTDYCSNCPKELHEQGLSDHGLILVCRGGCRRIVAALSTTNFECLRVIALEQLSLPTDTLIGLLKSSRSTLRSVALAFCELKDGSWYSIFDFMIDYLPYLEMLRLAKLNQPIATATVRGRLVRRLREVQGKFNVQEYLQLLMGSFEAILFETEGPTYNKHGSYACVQVRLPIASSTAWAYSRYERYSTTSIDRWDSSYESTTNHYLDRDLDILEQDDDRYDLEDDEPPFISDIGGSLASDDGDEE
ncbi:hypothetical protein N0V90_009394 [Kalmusia sp. IMI 367209]|nr:hypothetical protein N0V90_009394 [Kalmusia sp. IMI 367209]